VELARFGGETTDGGARLRWRTAAEQNNAGFRIQRRVEDAEANPWTKVGFVESKAPGGTTSESNRYRFSDEDLPFAADSVSYRLVQIDVGGSVVYSDPITLDRSAVQTLQLKAPYPNPARNRVKVPFAVPEGPAEADVSIRLYDILGRRIQTVKAQAAPGRHRHVLEVNDLASGVYFLRLRAGDASEVRKVTVVR
jgi:hypothetical protein